MSRRSRTIYVNEAFRPQRISGQQRYAREISDRMPAGVVRVAPGRFWSGSALRTWLWVQSVLPLRTRRGVLLSLTARAPLWHPRHVLVVHDLFVLEHPEWFSRRYHLTHAPLLRLQLRTSKAFVAVSAPVADQVAEIRPDAPAVVAPNAASSVFGGRGGEDALRAWGLETGSYFAVVGSLEPRKNLARLAEAYGLLDDGERRRSPLVIIGGGAEVFRDSVVTWPEGTVLTGYVDDDQLRALYAHSLAVVFPSLAEGFGLPIVEAVAAGASHLVLSDIPVFRWIAGDGAEFVDPLEVASISVGLERAIRRDVPEADRGAVERFSWTGSSDAVVAELQRVASE